MQIFKHFRVFWLATASPMLEASKKAALWAAALSMLALNLIFSFSCEVEAQRIKFSVSSGQELVHAEWNQVFVNLDFIASRSAKYAQNSA